jgi:hypothetical protein
MPSPVAKAAVCARLPVPGWRGVTSGRAIPGCTGAGARSCSCGAISGASSMMSLGRDAITENPARRGVFPARCGRGTAAVARRCRHDALPRAGRGGDAIARRATMLEIGGIGGLIVLVLDIWALVSIVGSSNSTGSKVLWSLLVILLPIIGFIIWLVAGPRAVQGARR